ncbi:MAG: OsmC family protein [Candidatus Caldatribacterium sp.]|uniref:OsmC family protein n=1 Tax=Candidatus Caldatribacterium sp. TaxID=2282143 RepID=UPI0029962342|nr:OsmC family protein [Candidatus Caldatribacterium sp.]MCX7729623.1 OsmC family protein [Candidatus Caldatribacterium sp.]MDW8080416.1 OsmC family protein [Candidatus Calescibacterium sp.]
MAHVELIAQRGKIEAHIGEDTVLFKSSGAESAIGHWPTEYILAALGSCFAGTVFAYAKTKDLPLEKVVISLEGEVAAAPSRIARITMEIEFIGNLTRSEKERLLTAGERACTVMNTLKGGVESIVTSLKE